MRNKARTSKQKSNTSRRDVWTEEDLARYLNIPQFMVRSCIAARSIPKPDYTLPRGAKGGTFNAWRSIMVKDHFAVAAVRIFQPEDTIWDRDMYQGGIVIAQHGEMVNYRLDGRVWAQTAARCMVTQTASQARAFDRGELITSEVA